MTQPETQLPDWLSQGDPNEYLQVTFTRGETAQFLQLLPYLRKMPTLVEVVKTMRDTTLPELNKSLAAVASLSDASKDDTAIEALYQTVQQQGAELVALRELVTSLSDTAPKRTRTKKVEPAEVPLVAPAPVAAPVVPEAVLPPSAMPVAVPTPVATPVPVQVPIPTVSFVAASTPVVAPVVPQAAPVPQTGAELLAAAGKTPADAAEIDAINAQIAALGIGAPL